MVYSILFDIVLYLYVTYCLYRIADRLEMENPWLAFVPVLNLVLMCAMIDKPLWYAILFFIPLVGLVWTIIVWMRLAEELGRPSWWGAIIIIPLVNLVMLAYLTFTDSRTREAGDAYLPGA